MLHIGEIIDNLIESGALPPIDEAPEAPPAGFPCDVGITVEEVNSIIAEDYLASVDEYTAEEARQSQTYFEELLAECEREVFDSSHPNGRH